MTYKVSIIFSLVLCVNVICGSQEPQKCCKNEKNLLVNRRCAPDQRTAKSPAIGLTCEEKYILNPNEAEEDAFNITKNGTLFIPDMGSFLFHDE